MEIQITILIFCTSFILWKLFTDFRKGPPSIYFKKRTVEEVFPDCSTWKKHKTRIAYKNPDPKSSHSRVAWFDAFIPGDNKIVVILNIHDGRHRREVVKLEDIKKVWN